MDKKKKKALLYIGLAVLTVITIGVAYWWWQSSNKANQAAATATGSGGGFSIDELKTHCNSLPNSEYAACMLAAEQGVKYG